MFGNLIRQLFGRADAREQPGSHGDAAALLETVRRKLHPLLREGKVAEALMEFAPWIAAESATNAVRNLVEFSVQGIAGLARQEAWRASITYHLGCILLSYGDEEGARLCAAIAWGKADADRGYRKFERGGDLLEYCRGAGLPARHLPRLDVVRMDGLPEPAVVSPRSWLCQLPGAQVIGEAFLPVSADGRVFTERCTDAPLKIERFDGLQWLEMLRLASEDSLWAVQAGVDRYDGKHVLIGNHENIGHWLLFYFSRLQAIDEAPEFADAKIVVGESVKPLHLECLRLAGIGDDRIVRIAKGRYAQFEELWVPSFSCGISSNRLIYWAPDTLAFVRRKLGVSPPAGGGGRRVFLSRRGVRWRRLLNEDEVMAALSEWDFEEIDAGRLTLREQIDLAAETSAIVGCFGAGMNFHLFAGEGVPVIQLQLEERVRMNIHPAIAHALKQPFHAVVGDIKVRHADPLKSDFEVPPKKILDALAGVLDRH